MSTETMTKILDGKVVSESVLEGIKEKLSQLAPDSKRPGLATILVGEDPASQAYVRMKRKACERVGIESFHNQLSANISESELTTLIEDLNNNPDVHGILLQLPLPKGLDEDKMLGLISPEKDVDGFHPVSVGKLVLGLPTFRSCTPYGVIELLSYYGKIGRAHV